MYIREACVETLEEALEAQRLGADRLEYCSALEHDGLTPPYSDIKHALEIIDIPIMVMVRPRKGNFEYTEIEFQEMIEQVKTFKKIGVAGVVFGILNGSGVDRERTRQLSELARPLEVCFHKAIDEVEDLEDATATLALIPNITRILTSGGAPTAAEGIPILKKMMKVAGGRLSIMPAGKVRPENISSLHKELGAKEYHGRGIVS